MIEKTINFSRRVFVEKTATAVAGLSIAPGVFLHQVANAKRSEERRVGKECRSRGAPDH